MQRLRALDGEKRAQFYQHNIGSVQQVLVERRSPQSGLLQGFSANYLPILFPGPSALLRQVVPVRITGMDEDQPMGYVVDEVLEENRGNR